jgi:hypothetical protein
VKRNAFLPGRVPARGYCNARKKNKTKQHTQQNKRKPQQTKPNGYQEENNDDRDKAGI